MNNVHLSLESLPINCMLRTRVDMELGSIVGLPCFLSKYGFTKSNVGQTRVNIDGQDAVVWNRNRWWCANIRVVCNLDSIVDDPIDQLVKSTVAGLYLEEVCLTIERQAAHGGPPKRM